MERDSTSCMKILECKNSAGKKNPSERAVNQHTTQELHSLASSWTTRSRHTAGNQHLCQCGLHQRALHGLFGLCEATCNFSKVIPSHFLCLFQHATLKEFKHFQHYNRPPHFSCTRIIRRRLHLTFSETCCWHHSMRRLNKRHTSEVWQEHLLSDTGRNDQLITLDHILQLTQIAHIVDLPAKLKTERERKLEWLICEQQWWWFSLFITMKTEI